MPQMSAFNWTLMFPLFLLMTIAFMTKMFFNKKISILFNYKKHNNSTTPILYMWTW